MTKILFPCMAPRLVPTEKIIANDYNPNYVATPEMELLARSIENNGLVYAITVFYDAGQDIYIVVDGFHRFVLLRDKFKCREIPVVIIDKDMKERMAATIEMNRARGTHIVDLMSALVVKLIKLGWTDIDIAKELGMEAEEVLRLKQMTGLAGLFAGQPYSKAWERYEPEKHGE